MTITLIALCRRCHKAIAEGDNWEGWLHFVSPAEDHDAEPSLAQPQEDT